MGGLLALAHAKGEAGCVLAALHTRRQHLGDASRASSRPTHEEPGRATLKLVDRLLEQGDGPREARERGWGTVVGAFREHGVDAPGVWRDRQSRLLPDLDRAVMRPARLAA